MELLRDSADGFSAAAEKLADAGHLDLAKTFATKADQRTRFCSELERLAATYGDDLEASGSIKAAVHRAWMSVKDTLSGDDPQGLLEAALMGELYAESTYNDALEENTSVALRSVLDRHMGEIRKARIEVRILNEAAGD